MQMFLLNDFGFDTYPSQVCITNTKTLSIHLNCNIRAIIDRTEHTHLIDQCWVFKLSQKLEEKKKQKKTAKKKKKETLTNDYSPMFFEWMRKKTELKLGMLIYTCLHVTSCITRQLKGFMDCSPLSWISHAIMRLANKHNINFHFVNFWQIVSAFANEIFFSLLFLFAIIFHCCCSCFFFLQFSFLSFYWFYSLSYTFFLVFYIS